MLFRHYYNLLILIIPFNYSSDDGKEGGVKTMIMEATARHNILNSIIYKRKKWLPLSVLDRRKSLYQAVSAHLPTGNSAGTAYLHCIKDGTNIDPPYNTGNDFIYKDDFKKSKEDYEEEQELFDEEGNRLFKNTETNGRFHSDWCSMMYSRLMLAKNLLSDDGVIFISIDDNEQSNIKKICEEAFGEVNFINNIIWEKKFSPQNDAKWLSDNHDFVVCFAKNKNLWRPRLLERTEEQNSRYSNPDNDPRGPWASSDLSVKTYSESYNYPIKTPTGKVVNLPPGRCWMTNKEKMDDLIKDNRIWFGREGNNLPRLKRFLSEVKKGITPITIWKRDEVGDTQEAKKELLKIMPENLFQTPKPTRLIDKLIYISNVNENDIILDFFSGSATTANAVFKQNILDSGSRKFIMVQLPEAIDKKSEAYLAGFENICEIGKERIRRAAKKLAEENPEVKFDGGFRVLKVDDSNVKDVYYAPDEYDQDMIEQNESNIKSDRNDLDLLFGCLIEWGIPLNLSYKEEELFGKKVYTYNDGDLIACFDNKVNEELIKEIANRKP